MGAHLKEEEYELIKQFVVIEYTRKVLERDLDKVPKAGFKFYKLYEEIIIGAVYKLSSEMRTVKIQMKKIGLKFNEKGTNDIGAIKIEWFRGGYQGTTGIRVLVLKEFVHVKIGELLRIKE